MAHQVSRRSNDTPTQLGAVAQLGERWLCKPEVTGSIPVGSTTTKDFDSPKSCHRSLTIKYRSSSVSRLYVTEVQTSATAQAAPVSETLN